MRVRTLVRKLFASTWARAGSSFRIIAQNSSLQHTTIRSALGRFVPACPAIGFSRPWFVVVVHGAVLESSCVLDVDCGGGCLSQGSLIGRFCWQRFVLTNHTCGCIGIATVFVENETHSQPDSLGWKDFVVSPCGLYVSGFVWTNGEKSLHIRVHGHKHHIQFLLSVLPIASTVLQ